MHTITKTHIKDALTSSLVTFYDKYFENFVSDGVLLAEIEDDVDVFLNMNGEAGAFSEGYAVVSKKAPVTDMYIYSYIDTNGNTVIG